MRPEDIFNAIGGVKDELLEEAEKLSGTDADVSGGQETPAPVDITKKSKRRKFISRFAAVAASLAVIIGGAFAFNLSRKADADPDNTVYTDKAVLLAEARDPLTGGVVIDGEDQGAVPPEHPDAAEDVKGTDPSKLAERLAGPEGAKLLMPDDGENHTYSPINISLAMAMLTETTDGDTRQQIMELLGVKDEKELRALVSEVFKDACYDTENAKSMLANSLWLRSDGTKYDKDVLKILAEYYCASSFAGEMGSAEYNKMLQDWLNEHTGDLLKEQASEMGFEPSTVIALASTIYFHADWVDPFYEEATQNETFHAPGGDTEVPMMHTYLMDDYFRGEHFGAVKLRLMGGNYFWIFLPDEGYGTQDIISDPAMMTIIKQNGTIEGEPAMIDLKLPRFDISGKTDLKDAMQEMGISDVFKSGTADFSPLLGDEGSAYVSKIDHASRVAVDEYGVTAAAFTVISADGGALPPEKQVQFICDRPFVFAVTNVNGLVLFEGTVNRP